MNCTVFYVIFLWFFCRNSLQWNILYKYLAVRGRYTGSVSNLINLLWLNIGEVLFDCILSESNKFFRSVEYAWHCKRACFSSSIWFGQNGQNRLFLSIRSCLPVSILRQWLESLNVVKAVRWSMFWISLRYISYPGSVVKRLYVLNLLVSLFISWKVLWWKISLRRWNAHKWALLSLLRKISCTPFTLRVYSIRSFHVKLCIMLFSYHEDFKRLLHFSSLQILTQFLWHFLSLLLIVEFSLILVVLQRLWFVFGLLIAPYKTSYE